MTLQKIEFEYDIPDGYRFVRFGRPSKDDLYLNSEGKIHQALWNIDEDWIIVEKIPEQEQPTENSKRHKHADLIHAWAEGAEIQYKSVLTGIWADCTNNRPEWSVNGVYRIKPKTKTIRFRNYLSINGNVYVSYDNSPVDEFFKKWLGDWQDVEVEE